MDNSKTLKENLLALNINEPLDLSLKITKSFKQAIFDPLSANDILNCSHMIHRVPNERSLSLPDSSANFISTPPDHDCSQDTSIYNPQEKPVSVICYPDIMWLIASTTSSPELYNFEESSSFQKSDILEHHQVLRPSSDYNKDYKCNSCDKVYTSASALKLHLANHTLSHSCEICGKSFSRRNILKVHKRIHTGEKPFLCLHCNRPFADKSSFRRHVEIHADKRKSYQCTKCNASFTRRDSLKLHKTKICLKKGN